MRPLVPSAQALDAWAHRRGVKLAFSRPGHPGTPTDNPFIEDVNRCVRHDGLDQHWLLSLEEARTNRGAWREDDHTTPLPGKGQSAPAFKHGDEWPKSLLVLSWRLKTRASSD